MAGEWVLVLGGVAMVVCVIGLYLLLWRRE